MDSIKQLTCLSTSSSCTSSTGVLYNYPSSANNGKIASQADGVSGETVTYTYDTLNRLQKAENQCASGQHALGTILHLRWFWKSYQHLNRVGMLRVLRSEV